MTSFTACCQLGVVRFNQCARSLSGQIFGYDEYLAVLRPDVMHGHNSGVSQLGKSPRLPQQPLGLGSRSFDARHEAP